MNATEFEECARALIERGFSPLPLRPAIQAEA
ncbi:hypothetical protein GGQ85_000205 [Nitrobacter vulgaris]|nr:hypothetical protein [Nitrobacter vulgaris]